MVFRDSAKGMNDFGTTTIVRSAACYFGITEEQLMSGRKDRKCSRPRMVAMALMRQMMDMSYPRIGEFFDRHHTTVMHAVKAVRAMPEMRRPLEELACSAMTIPLVGYDIYWGRIIMGKGRDKPAKEKKKPKKDKKEKPKSAYKERMN